MKSFYLAALTAAAVLTGCSDCQKNAETDCIVSVETTAAAEAAPIANDVRTACAAKLEANGFALLQTADPKAAAVCSPLTTFEGLSVLQQFAAPEAQKAIGSFGGTADLLAPAQNYFVELNALNSIKTAQILMYRPSAIHLPEAGEKNCLKNGFCGFFACEKTSEYAPKINAFVNKVTNGMIPELASPGDITDATVLALASACAFNGTWKDPFTRQEDEKIAFQLPGEKNELIPSMHANQPAQYAVNDGYRMIQLPFKQPGVVIEMYLPDEVKTPQELIKEMTPQRLAALRAKLELKNDVAIDLPLIKIESKYDMLPFMRANGCSILGDALARPFAPLQLSASQDPFVLGVAKQVAVFELDEEGVRAAAADLMTCVCTCAPMGEPPPSFHANRPFAFTIRAENPTAPLTLFCGYFLPEAK